MEEHELSDKQGRPHLATLRGEDGAPGIIAVGRMAARVDNV